VVKVIWHKTASPPQTNGSIDLPGGANVPKKEATLASPGEYDWTCASFSTPESTAQTVNRSVQPFLHSSRQKVSILYNGGPFPPKLPLPTGDLDLHVRHDSLDHPSPQTNRHLYRFTGGTEPPSNTWFPGPTRVLNPNGISISSAVLAGLTSVTDRQTTLLAVLGQ